MASAATQIVAAFLKAGLRLGFAPVGASSARRRMWSFEDSAVVGDGVARCGEIATHPACAAGGGGGEPAGRVHRTSRAELIAALE